jgi:hypothetical protein
MASFVQTVSMKLKCAEIVNRKKVFLNFRKTKRVLLAKFHEEEVVILAGVTKNPYLPEQEPNSKE